MLTAVDAADLLRGPRGRRLCYEFIRSSLDQPAPRERVEVDSQAAVEAIVETCNWAMYWQPPDSVDADLRSGEWLHRLRDTAEAITSSPVTSWWSSPLAIDDQHLVRFLDEDSPERTHEPTLSSLNQAVRALEEEHSRAVPDDMAGARVDWRTVSGVWWSTPMTYPAVYTARSVGRPPIPSGLVFVEDSLGWTAATSWQVVPTPGVKVLELGAPEQWVDLVRRYPLDVTATTKRGDWWRTTGRDGRWAMPRWPSVAEDWDAVHLSVAGYLTTAGRALPVDADTATVLAGWPPDATFWLSDALRVTGPATSWRRDSNAHAWTRA